MKNLLDIHTHSVLSTHAYSSLTENIDEAVKKGLSLYGISEHQSDHYGVGAHFYAFGAICSSLPKYMENTRLLKGIELNIVEGDFDLENINVNRLDYCIASMHEFCYPPIHSKEFNTERLIYACNQPYVKILGHIDNPNFPCDYEAVVKEAVKTKTLIEINNHSLDAESPRKGADINDRIILELCKKYRCPIIMNSDAHIRYDVGNIENSIKIVEEADFPQDLICNYNLDLLKQYINF